MTNPFIELTWNYIEQLLTLSGGLVKVKVNGEQLYAVIIEGDAVHLEFRDVIPNEAARVEERYGVGNVYIPMGVREDRASQWWTVSRRGVSNIIGWHHVKDEDLPEPVKLWLMLVSDK